MHERAFLISRINSIKPQQLNTCSKPTMATSMPLEVYLLTFNCARTLLDPALLGARFFQAWPKDKDSLPDVVAVSLQEVTPIAYSFLGGPFITDYLERVQQSLQIAAERRTGSSNAYYGVQAHSVGMTSAMVFVKKELKNKISDVQIAGVGVGVWEMGNKGSAAIRLSVGGQELTFVAAHLAPMEDQVERRNKDWEDIVKGTVFTPAPRSENKRKVTGAETQPLLAKQDTGPKGIYDTEGHVFIFGDLNYRTSSSAPADNAHQVYPQPSMPQSDPDQKIRIELEELWAKDQLTQERGVGRTLHAFQEASITFPPTYKYSHGSSKVPGPQLERGSDDSDAESDSDAEEDVDIKEPKQWTWARHRWPSWCDRILYYPPNETTTHKYTALPLLPSSDHRAVALHVTLTPVAKGDPNFKQGGEKAPFELDVNWKSRRAAARRYEIAVGMASWVVLTGEGQTAIGGLLCGALLMYILMRSSSMGMFQPA